MANSKFLKFTFHNGDDKFNAYLKMPSPTFVVLKKELSIRLFDERQQMPNKPIRIFWIDEDHDEIDIVNQCDYEIFMTKRSERQHLQVELENKTDNRNSSSLEFCNMPNAETRPSVQHENVECDECKMLPIVGFRYKCIQCANYDLCEACEFKHKHVEHMMVRMPHDNCPSVIDAWASGSSMGRRRRHRNTISSKNVSTNTQTQTQNNYRHNRSSQDAAAKTPQKLEGASGSSPSASANASNPKQNRQNIFGQLFNMMNGLAEGGVPQDHAASIAAEASKVAAEASKSAHEAALKATELATKGVQDSTSSIAVEVNKAAHEAALKAVQSAFKSTQAAAETIAHVSKDSAEQAAEAHDVLNTDTATEASCQKEDEKKSQSTTQEANPPESHTNSEEKVSKIILIDNQKQANSNPKTVESETNNSPIDNLRNLNICDETTTSTAEHQSPKEQGIVPDPNISVDNNAQNGSVNNLNTSRNVVPRSPTLAELVQYMDPKYIRAGLEILNNFSEMFAKMLESDNVSNASSNINEQPKNSVDTLNKSTQSGVTPNTSDSDSDNGDVSSTVHSINKSKSSENVDENDWQFLDRQSTISDDGSDNLSDSVEIVNSIVNNNHANGDNEIEQSKETDKENHQSSAQITTSTAATTTTTSSPGDTVDSAAEESKNIQAQQQERTQVTTENRAVPVYHRDELINASIISMMAMGFSNEGNALTHLLESVNGDMLMALDFLTQQGN